MKQQVLPLHLSCRLRVFGRPLSWPLALMMCRPEPISELALQVKWLATPSAHPDFITVEADVSHDGVPVELENWGFRIRAVLCDERSVAVCLNLKADEDQTYEYVFVNLDVEDDTDILVHSSPKVLSTSDLMATLYKLGFWRAVINTTETVYTKEDSSLAVATVQQNTSCSLLHCTRAIPKRPTD